MDSKTLLLSTMVLLGLWACADGKLLRIRRSTHGDGNRSHWRRRSISLADLPGSPGQSLPAEAMEWTLRHQACHWKEITQNVSQTGCEPQQIKNRMCYGVCANIHVPGVPGSEELEMCTKCQPAGKRPLITVTLNCAGGTTRTVTVPTVERCACSPCHVPVG